MTSSCLSRGCPETRAEAEIASTDAPAFQPAVSADDPAAVALGMRLGLEVKKYLGVVPPTWTSNTAAKKGSRDLIIGALQFTLAEAVDHRAHLRQERAGRFAPAGARRRRRSGAAFDGYRCRCPAAHRRSRPGGRGRAARCDARERAGAPEPTARSEPSGSGRSAATVAEAAGLGCHHHADACSPKRWRHAIAIIRSLFRFVR